MPDLDFMRADDHGRWVAGQAADMALGLRTRLGRGGLRHGVRVSAGLDLGADDAGVIGAGVVLVLQW